MKNKIKTAVGILMMITMMAISEKVNVFIVYIVAAILHEIGHLLTAKMLKIKIKQIFFDFSGIRIEVDNSITSYRSEAIMALSGPFINVLSAFVVSMLLIKMSSIDEIIIATDSFISTGQPHIIGVSGFFILVSCVQAAINLMPIKSFDGGRALYCCLTSFFNTTTAQIVVSITSAIFAFTLWTISLYLMLRISSGLGIFVFSSSIFVLMLTDSDFFENKEKECDSPK